MQVTMLDKPCGIRNGAPGAPGETVEVDVAAGAELIAMGEAIQADTPPSPAGEGQTTFVRIGAQFVFVGGDPSNRMLNPGGAFLTDEELATTYGLPNVFCPSAAEGGQ